YRRNSEQLASFDTLARTAAAEPTPYEEVRDFFHFVDNYIHELDLAAEDLAARIGIPDRDPSAAFPEHLETAHGIRTARMTSGDHALRRFDPERRTLHLDPFSPVSTRSFQIAFQIGALEMAGSIDALIENAGFRTAEAREICR